MAERAARRNSAVRPVVGDALSLPFIDQYFDVVVATELCSSLRTGPRCPRALPSDAAGARWSSSSPGRVQGSADASFSHSRGGVSFGAMSRCAARTRSPKYAVSSPSSGASCARCGRVRSRTRPRRCCCRVSAAMPTCRWRPHLESSSRDCPAPVADGCPFAWRTSLAGRRRPRCVGPRRLAEAGRVRGLVKPLRWRKKPHVQGILRVRPQAHRHPVPLPFIPFWRTSRIERSGSARRTMALPMVWRRLRFERPDELIRYLYCTSTTTGTARDPRAAAAQRNACDRFRLANSAEGEAVTRNSGWAEGLRLRQTSHRRATRSS